MPGLQEHAHGRDCAPAHHPDASNAVQNPRIPVRKLRRDDRRKDTSMSALAVGMYVRLTGKSTGRIVDRRVLNGALLWLVKLDGGKGVLVWARSEHLAERK